MTLNGIYIVIVVGAWLAYKLGCWVDARATDREVGSPDV